MKTNKKLVISTICKNIVKLFVVVALLFFNISFFFLQIILLKKKKKAEKWTLELNLAASWDFFFLLFW